MKTAAPGSERSEDARQIARRELLPAGLALGIGLGGLLDGILFHQIFQLHGMLTAKLPPTTLENLQHNMYWDGIFSLVTWAVTAVGVALLWRASRCMDLFAHGGSLAGSALVGWGLFNLVEGVIDHHLLDLHHLVERLGVSVWDWLFLASGLVLIGIGTAMLRADLRSTRPRRPLGEPQPEH